MSSFDFGNGPVRSRRQGRMERGSAMGESSRVHVSSKRAVPCGAGTVPRAVPSARISKKRPPASTAIARVPSPEKDAVEKGCVCLWAKVVPRSPSNQMNQLSATAGPCRGASTVALSHTASGRVGWLARRK